MVDVSKIKLPDLIVTDGVAYADSRDVARVFDKAHTSVTRSVIEAHCSLDFRLNNFVQVTKKVRKNNEWVDETLHTLMTYKGFCFVALGWTGAKAGEFKEAYINKFETMAEDLSGKHVTRRSTSQDKGDGLVLVGQALQMFAEGQREMLQLLREMREQPTIIDHEPARDIPHPNADLPRRIRRVGYTRKQFEEAIALRRRSRSRRRDTDGRSSHENVRGGPAGDGSGVTPPLVTLYPLTVQNQGRNDR